MEGQTTFSKNLRFIESKKKLKVSQSSLKFPCQKLITASNNHGLVIVGSEDQTIKALPIDYLLDFSQSKDKSAITNFQQFSFSNKLTFRPTLLSVARDGNSPTLLVAGVNTFNCTVIEVFDLDTNKSIGKLDLNDLINNEIIDYAWHPNYHDPTVALCTDKGHLLVVTINKKDGVALAYRNPNYGALTCCWSPKGKNLAIGMSNGNILRFEPIVTASSFTLKEVDRSTIDFSPRTRITPEHRVIKLRWITRTFLMAVHAKQSAEFDTIYSIITVKPSKPYSYWTNLCYESRITSNHQVYLVNLTHSVICTSNITGEAAVIGGENSTEATEIQDWKSIIIDEEGARIELPLDSNNIETHPAGVSLAFSRDLPILLFLTTDNVICSYAAAMQKSLTTDNVIGSYATATQKSPTTDNVTSSYAAATPNDQKPNHIILQDFEPITEHIDEIKTGIKLINESLTSLKQVNELRDKLSEIEDIHHLHQEALDSVKNEIESLDLAMLENLFLIEHIKSQNTRQIARDINPNTLKKIGIIKNQTKLIAEKLKELDSHVELAWDGLARSSKPTQLKSLDLLYHTLATNQRIINILKKKVSKQPDSKKTEEPADHFSRVPAIKELDSEKMRSLRNFLSARTVVPVRCPIGGSSTSKIHDNSSTEIGLGSSVQG